jgi:hypothetical protein
MTNQKTMKGIVVVPYMQKYQKELARLGGNSKYIQHSDYKQCYMAYLQRPNQTMMYRNQTIKYPMRMQRKIFRSDRKTASNPNHQTCNTEMGEIFHVQISRILLEYGSSKYNGIKQKSSTKSKTGSLGN